MADQNKDLCQREEKKHHAPEKTASTPPEVNLGVQKKRN
jgi:hypothetical protein